MFVGKSWKVVTKHLFHDANSKRGGVLMHSKVCLSSSFEVEANHQVLVAIFEKQDNPLGLDVSNGNSKKRKAEGDDDKPEIGGWAYMGSHNFTPSAWVRFPRCTWTRLMYRAMSTSKVKSLR